MHQRLNNLMKRVARLERLSSEEGRFFDNPLKKSVREFAESEAISNDIEVSENASEAIETEKPKSLLKSEAIVAPPTPTEIKKKPGGKEFSTLNQLVLETEERVRVPKAQMSGEIPSSLEEGKKDVAQKAKERDVSKAEKVRAVREVMKKKASLLFLRSRSKDTKKKKKQDDDWRSEDSDRETKRERAELERQRKKDEEARAKKKQEKADMNKRVDENIARRKQEAQKALEDQVKSYDKLTGSQKGQLTRKIYKKIRNNVLVSRLKDELKKADAKDKAKILMRALKSIEEK
jgi:hypothetical protein